MKKLLVSLVLFFACAMVVQAQEDKAYEAAMTKMLEVSKSMDAMKQLAPQIIAMTKQQAPGAPQEFWNELEKTMVGMYDEIIKAMIPVYHKYLSLEDIQGIIKFYETPVGQKLADSNTKIAAEVMPIAQKIAMETMQKMMAQAKEKGYVK